MVPGGRIRLLIAKPGLDGHGNRAEQIVVAARDAGMEVIYSGRYFTPAQIAATARAEAAVYTPRDFELGKIMNDIVSIAKLHRAGAA